MCDCFHLAFPNWHAASGTGAGRRLRAPEPGTEDDSICDEPSQFTEGERPRPQGSSPVEEYPETEKYTDSDKECEAEHDPHHKSGSGKKTKKSGLGSMFEKRSTPKMSKLKEVHSPESGVIVKTAKDGCAEGLVYGGGGKEGIFIKEVVPESPASKSLKLKEGDQILSATVYFDNVSYEDAIQILEHAQAYKVKLCLKRKPDIIETEPATESDVIPEDDLYAPEMREQGKTKRRGDARISWPKFPSFGKGRKSRFARSHSSSEADEQRKLELSPTTSDTESPIKSQDALKGKKQKIKQSVFKRRGRVSSSEDQDTDAPTSGQISGNILQTHEASDMLSPECLESPSGETPEVYVTEDPKEVDDLMLHQNDQKLTESQTQHKAELITIGSTLKTEDLTVALADQKSPSGLKSPDGKKKKKERSEFKMKILGKDKLHKKDAKAKSSPKRLKTLGASIEIADHPENEKSDVQGGQLALDANTQIISSQSSRVISAKSVPAQMEMSIPKVELDISDVALIEKSPQKGEEKTRKGKDIKQKQETRTGPTFKLPKIGFSDIATEETIQKINLNVEERQAKIEQLTTQGSEVKEDPYERLSKSSLSRTKLPKREDIEIPGMEDMSMRTTAKIIKDPKAVSTGHHEQIQAETVQMSIDVDSVKEAVSKLPGFKLPKVDTSGVPIPEEITVIDANAQRISVKTPTKVLDTKTRHEAHFPKFDITASPEISKTTVKLPKITPADLTTDELLIETRVDLKTPEKKYKTKAKQEIKTEVYKREHIIIPGKESAQEVAILQQKQAKTSTTETLKGKGQTEGVISDVKIPEIDSIEYIDSVGGSPAKNDGGIRLTGFGVNLDAAKPKADISFPEIRGEVKHVEAEKQTFKLPKLEALTADNRVNVLEADTDINIDVAEIKTLEGEEEGSKFKMPNLGISMPKVKGPKIDLSSSKKGVDVTQPEDRAEVRLPDVPEVDIGNVSVQEQKLVDERHELEVKTLQTEHELDGKESKFKMPKFGVTMPKVKGPEIEFSLSKKDKDVTLPEAKVKFPEEVLAVDIRAPSVDTEEPSIDMKTTGTEHEGKGSKFKMPHLGFSMPKVKGPQVDISLSKKDVDITLPESSAEVKLPEAPEVNVSLAKADVSLPEDKVEVKKPEIEIKPLQTEAELDEQGSKFKMPRLGMSLPKVKGPEIDFSLSKKDKDVTLPEAKAEVKLPDVKMKEHSVEVEIKAPEIKVATKDTEESPSKFKMPTFKLPKFGVGTTSSSVEVPDTDKDVKLNEADLKFPEEVLAVDIKAPSIDTEEPSLDIKTTGTEHAGKGSKFKMPHLGFSMPKVKGPQVDISLSKKDVDITLPESSAEVKLPEAPEVNVSLAKADVFLPEDKVEVKKPEIEIKPPHTEAELDEQGSKFKMPRLAMSMPKVKGPEINFGLSKKDGDVTLPEAKAEIKVPEVELKEPSVVEIKTGETKVAAKGRETSPSKFKMPTFKVPKFGVGTPNVSVEVPGLDKDVKIDGADINIPEERSVVNIAAPSIDIEGPLIDMKTTGTEQDGRGSKFKMPHLGFSMSKVKGPKIDLSLSKKDVDVTLPEAKADVKLPEVDFGKADVSIPEAKMGVPEGTTEVNLQEAPKIAVEIKPTECEAEMDSHGGTFKIPKLGIKIPKVKGPEFDLSLSKKDVEVKLPETKADIKLPEVDLGKVEFPNPEAEMEVKKPELEMQSLQTEGELDGQGEKFQVPKFGIKMPKVKGPEIDLSLSKKNVDVTLPQTKAEVKLPDEPKIDVSLGKAEVMIPEAKAKVKKPELKMKPLQSEIELEGQGGKFTMPKFGIKMPKVKGPEINLSLSRKDVDVTLPESKAEIKLPEAPDIDFNLGKVDVSVPEEKMEVKKPEMKSLQSEGELDGQGSKFKMPKFGMSMPKLKGPEIDLSLSKKDVDMTLPEVKAKVNIPDVELKEPSAKVEIKAPEIEDQLSHVKESPSKYKLPTFKFPKFGLATPIVSAEVPVTDKEIKIDGADMHISMPHTDVDVPEVKADVHLPEIKVKEPSGEVVIEQQPGVEIDAKMKKPRFSMPKFSFSKPNVKAPGVEVSLKDVNVAVSEGNVEVKGEEVEMKAECEAEIDGQGSKLTLPKFGITMPKVKGPEFDLNFSKKDGDVTLPEVKAEVELPETPKVAVEMKPPECEAEIDAQGSKFKMPKFGITRPEFDLSLSKKDADVTLPEAKVKVKPLDIDMKDPSAHVEIKAPDIKIEAKDADGSPSKFKMPTFKLPKFGIGTPSATIEVPDTNSDVKIDGGDIKIPEEVLAVDIAAPSIDTEGPSIDMKTTGTEHEGKGSKFKMPKFGMTMPKVTGPEIDLSLSKKDVDLTLPDAKAEVKLPDVEMKEHSAELEIKAPEIKVATKDTEGSPSKFKMPTFKLPKFGIGTPSATAEVRKDVKIDGGDIKIPEEVLAVDITAPSIDTEGPSIDMKTTETPQEGKGSKFKMPSLGFSVPQVKGPDFDLSVSKKDVDVTLPEAKAKGKLPDVKLKEPSVYVEIKAPEIEAQTDNFEGSPSKIKTPTFKLPKLGVTTPKVSVEVPDVDKDINIDGAKLEIDKEGTTVDVTAPSIDTKGLSVDVKVKGSELEGSGSKFKMPKFGISMPKVKGSEIDLSLSQKDVDVTLPEAKAKVQLPDVKVKEPEGAISVPDAPTLEVEAKSKRPNWTFPKFSFSRTGGKAPEVDVNIETPTVDVTSPEAKAEVCLPDVEVQGPSGAISMEEPPAAELDANLKKNRFSLPRISFSKSSVKELEVSATLPHVDVSLPEGNLEVKRPEVELKPLEGDAELEGQERKFKMPKFGISMPKVKGPELDLSLSKKDVDVTLPEAKAEVQLPDVKLKQASAKVEIKAPEIEAQTGHVEGSPSKFKMPTFKLPKFGIGTPSATAEVHKDVKITAADIQIPEEVLAVDITAPSIDTEGPSIDMKTTGTEHEGKGSKFKMPKFGMTMPKVTGPEIDLSLSKKDVDLTLPEAKAEVKLPEVEMKEHSAEVEIKAPEIKVTTKDTEGSPSKFKMPTFKLPKFGIGTPSATAEVHKDVKIDGADIQIPEEVLAVDITAPNIDTEGPSIDMKTTGTEHEGKGSKFKMPKFGITMPKVTGPEIDLSLSKKDVDLTLPEAKAEVKLPDVEMKEHSAEVEIKAPEIKVATKDTDGSPSKFKMPTFKLPKFGVGTPSATMEVPDTDKDVKITAADITIPEEVLAVDIAAPSIDTEGPSIDMKTTGTEHEGKGSKFKMPKFGMTMPKVTGPEIDLSLSKKDVDVILPEAKAEVKLPDVEMKEHSAEVEIKAPEIKVATKDTDGSPSKFKMPTFKLPKFGIGTPSATAEVHKDVKIDGGDIKIPEEVLAVDITAPSIDTEGPSIDMKTTETPQEGRGSKFKMPSLGFSVPQVKGPDFDLSVSKKDVDVTLPEAKAKGKLPDVKLKEPSVYVEIKAPEIEAQTDNFEGSPSKIKTPTFKLPKLGVTTPKVSVEVPDVDKDNSDGAKLEIDKEGATVDVTAPSIDTKGLSVDVKVKGSELEGSGSKFKMPKFGISMPKVKGSEIDLSLSQKDVDVTLPEAKAEVQLPDVKVNEPEGAISVPDAPTVEVEAKSKRPNWTFPKFSFSRTGGKAPEVDVNIETPTVDVTSPEAKAEVCLPDVEVQGHTGAISMEETPAAELDANLKKKKFSLPRISFSKSSVKEPEVSAKLPHVDVSLPEGNVEVKRPEVELKPLEGDAQLDGQESKFKMPKFGISMPKVKGPEIDLSLSKKDVDVTLPEAKAEVQLPDVKLKQASSKVETKAPEIEAQTGHVEGSPSKFKMPTFTLPKLGAATPKVSVEVPGVDKDTGIDGAKLEVSKEGATVDVTAPSIDTEGMSVDVKVKGGELEGSGSKFKMPKFGISMPKVKGPELDLSLSQKDVDVTLPEANAGVQLPDVKLKQESAKVEMKAPEIEAQTGQVEGSPSKFKMPTFTLPKLGVTTPKVSVEVPDVDKDTGIDGANLEVPKEGATVDVTAPCIDTEGISVDVRAKASKLEGSESKFKMPKFGISMPKVKGPEIDLGLSQKDVDVTLPEAKAEVQLPDVEVKEPEGAISVPDAPTVEVEAKSKRPNWTFPKFSFSRTGGKAPEVDVNLETPTVDVTSPEAKAEVCLPDVEVQGPSGAISMEEPPAAELDANLKKTRFSLPRMSFSKSSVKEPEVSAKLPHVDVSLPEGNVEVKRPDVAIEAPQLEGDGHDGQGTKLKLSKTGIALPKTKGRKEDLNASQKDVEFTEVKADVKLPEIESSARLEIKATKTEAKSKDVRGSPLKSKMPTVKMPKFGGATYDVTVEAPDTDKVGETNGAKDKKDVSVNIKGLDVDIKTDVCTAAITDSETPKPETDSVGLGSPSKFKLPSFKMPKLSFSRPKPEEHVPVETEHKEDKLETEVEPKGEIKSPKMTLTSFGEILKSVEVEEKDLETDEPNGKQLEKKEEETNGKQDTVKSPERTGWFKFPKFGLSSPSEPAKISEKEEHKDKKSSAAETVDEEISPTSSVQSSDAFADISSAVTSEHVGLSLSSPTKVTVKYSDPNAATGLGEMHSNIITSTTRTELISVEPNLPEKITIPSSGVSSSSEDTLRLESGRIHVITSNIQATPEAQHAKLLTAVQVQPAGGLPIKSEAHEATSWTVEDSQSGTRTVYERHLVRETSSETSESKGRIVITKQITHMFDSSVPGETASSIQRLKDSVHSEKIRFFDGAEK